MDLSHCLLWGGGHTVLPLDSLFNLQQLALGLGLTPLSAPLGKAALQHVLHLKGEVVRV